MPGLYPAVTFTYRPATPRARYELAQAEPGERLGAACRILCRQLVAVQVEGEKESIKLSEEQAAQLHAGVFQAMLDAVMGFASPGLSTDAAEGNC